MKTYTTKSNAKRAAQALAKKYGFIVECDSSPDETGKAFFPLVIIGAVDKVPEELKEVAIVKCWVPNPLPASSTSEMAQEQSVAMVQAEAAELPEENDCRRPVTFDEAGNAIDPLTALGGLIQPQDKITVVPGGMAIELHEETDSKLRKSLIERPCKEVWNIAEELHTANPQIKRREVLEECTKRGIAYYTARTQYQEWMRACKEMHTREAQAAAKK